MRMQTRERGVTLIELLVVIAILSLVLAGIYGMLNSAYQSYLNSRRRIEAQQTAMTVMNYLVFRLREIEGGPMTDQPWNCTNCHKYNVTGAYDAAYFCPRNVSKPRLGLYIGCPPSSTSGLWCDPKDPTYGIRTIALPQLATLPTTYQNMTGNAITFRADLLPIVGMSEGFTDKNNNGQWDWARFDSAYDKNMNGQYDWPEPELLEDYNQNSQYDNFSETWTLKLRPSSSGNYYELVESLDFNSLKPDPTKYNKSVYPTTGTGYPTFVSYTSQVVAYGLVGMSIQVVPRVIDPTVKPGQSVTQNCYDSSGVQPCHSSANTGTTSTNHPLNVYGDATNFDYVPFIAAHPWWNVRGLSVEVATASSNVQKEYYLKLKQFVIPRNLEINQ
jgi:prepilin-type N-terminal cleavage/methylation domain-containing protein